MKKLTLMFSLCLLAGMAFAQQNTPVQTTPVNLTAVPVGDCRQQFYTLAYVPSTGTLYGCNNATGAWATQVSNSGLTITSSSGTFTLANGKTFVVNNGLTLAGTDSTTMTFPSTSATIARTDAANTFTGTQTVGALVATTVNGNTITTGTGVLTLAASKTLTASNTLTLAGTDSTTMTFPSTSATIARTDAANTFTGVQTMTNAPPVISSITNTGTETLPSATGGIPVVIACGNTTTGTGTCANTAVGATSKVYFGNATLASNAQTVTISPGYTSSSTFQCIGNDQTTRANPVQVVPASGTTFTITNTTGASDVIQWICVGN